MPFVRKLLRGAVVGAIVGVVALGSAWAVIGTVTPTGDAGGGSGPSSADTPMGQLAVDLPTDAVAGERLPAGQFLAGGAKVSIAPRADKWQPNTDGSCGEDTATYLPAAQPARSDGKQCLGTFDHRWATTVDPLGIYARAVAIGNGVDTVVFASIDAVGWFAAYPSDVCGECGADAVALSVENATKDGPFPVERNNVVIASSHTHAAPDTLTQTPKWYYEQVRDALRNVMVDAAAAMEPVVLETGAAPAKAYNVDRRIFTRAVPDYEVGWLRAFRPADGTTPAKTVVTLVNYAAHPTVRVSNAELHSGFVGPLTRDLEAEVGGTAVWFAGGLGDQTVDRGFGTEGLGTGLANVVQEDLARGYRLQDNTIEVIRKPVDIPGENTFMMAARGAGLFVRELLPPYSAPGGPVTASKGGIPRPSCVTVAELMVRSSVTGIRIGRPGLPERGDPGDSLTIITAPGEIFSSIAVTTKDYLSKTRNVMVFGMSNDMVGYLIPYEQYDETAGQGAGLANNATDLGNYEEALSLGRCAGDVVQNAMLELGENDGGLGVMGSGESR